MAPHRSRRTRGLVCDLAIIHLRTVLRGARHTLEAGRSKVGLVTVAAALLLAGCGSAGGHSQELAAATERCTDRFLATAKPASSATSLDPQRYVERTYCGPFAREGWVYDDGALSIEAHEWLIKGYTSSRGCAVASPPGSTTETTPCQPGHETGAPLECAILHVVRKREVEEYVARLRKHGTVACDDGTSLDELGVP
jgi:hypothetical protein